MFRLFVFSGKCGICMKPIKEDGCTAFGKVYHKECFKCCVCKRRIDGKFFQKNGKPYCEKDYAVSRVENFLKGSLGSIPSPSPSMKIQIMGGKVCFAKHCRNFWYQKVCWHHPAMFCLIAASKVSRQWFEFSLKVKVMAIAPLPPLHLRPWLISNREMAFHSL